MKGEGMGKIVVASRVEVDEYVDFHSRVNKMRPKRSVSQRIRELMNADVKKWRKGKGKK